MTRLTILYLAGTLTAVHADTIAYTNLGNNDAYDYANFTGSGIIGGNFATRTEAAFRFTPTVGGDITSIRLALGANFAVTQGAVTLYSDAMTYPDPAQLTLELTGVPLFDVANPGNNQLALTVLEVKAGNRKIEAGKPYWLSVAPGLPDANGSPNALVWFDNSQGITGNFAQRTDPPRPRNDFVVFGDTRLGAFEVKVAEVPEPATFTTLGLALIATGLIARRRARLRVGGRARR
jgi:hypothetical protein